MGHKQSNNNDKNLKSRIFKLNTDIIPGNINDILHLKDRSIICEKLELKYGITIQNVKFENDNIYQYNKPQLKHHLLEFLRLCYDKHLSPSIRPDDIRMAIIVGASWIVTNNPFKYQDYFTYTKDKKNLVVINNNLKLNCKDNDWSSVIYQLSSLVKENVKCPQLIDQIQKKYSTTTELNSIVNNIVTLKTFEKFFSYECNTMCGFPEVELQGTLEDWLSIKNLVLCLEKCGMAWWTIPLMKLIDGFIEGADKNKRINKDFWNNLVKYHTISGGDKITGYLKLLIPIVKGKEVDWSNEDTSGYLGETPIIVNTLPSDDTSLNFVWNYLNNNISMMFISGNIGYTVENGKVSLCQYYIIALNQNCFNQCQNIRCIYDIPIPDHKKKKWVNCKTCFKNINNGICLSCAEICHKDHNLCNMAGIDIKSENFEPNLNIFYCDCHTLTSRIPNIPRNY
jgi:hypothetical protein